MSTSQQPVPPEPSSHTLDASRQVIRTTPLAYLACAFLLFAVTFPIFGNPAAFGWLILAPIVAAYAVARVRTVVTPEKITTRSMFRSDSIDWDDVTGFRFAERKPARAVLTDGTERVLPMVTFGRAPQLAAASGGRITDPYEAAVSAWREDEAAEEAAAAETDADENAATTGETTVDAEPAASRTPSRGDDPRE